ncbi:hypothetical protein F5887DRAFT_1070855 [Amanita rubescens]|nr:hypothetical protein F5887DRAFT_1070855 [Amanita rubescens]
MLPQRPQPAQTQLPPVTIDVQPRNTMMEMNSMNAPSRTPQCTHEQNGTSRIRGGGAAKDCFMAAIGVFVCFESCEVCTRTAVPVVHRAYVPLPRFAAIALGMFSAAPAKCSARLSRSITPAVF